MTAGTVVIAGGILATVILLTIVAVLCYCRLQQYCCKREEPDKEEGEGPEPTTVSSYRPCPSPERLGEPDMTSTFLTEVNGPAAYYSPPQTRKPARSHTFCPSCTRQALPFYLQRPERMRNGGGHYSYRTVQQQEVDLPTDMTSFHHKLIRSVTMREVVTHSISTDV